MLFDNYNKFINFKLKEIFNKNQFRQLKITKRRNKSYVENGNKKLLSFACNDFPFPLYLELCH